MSKEYSQFEYYDTCDKSSERSPVNLSDDRVMFATLLGKLSSSCERVRLMKPFTRLRRFLLILAM